MIKNYLAGNIQYLRKEKRLSQQKLASELGLTRSKIASYENEKAEPSTTKLAEIARYFDVSLNQLIEENLKLIPDTQVLASNTNIQDEISGFLEDRDEIIFRFEKKSNNFRKITEGLKAFHQLKRHTLSDSPASVQSLLSDFENLLSVMDNLVEFLYHLLIHRQDQPFHNTCQGQFC